MKRIAYLLVNEAGDIFGENEVFSSRKNANRQIKRCVKSGIYSEEVWMPQKIILNGRPVFKNGIFQTDIIVEMRAIVNVALWFIAFGAALQWIEAGGEMDLMAIEAALSLAVLVICLFYLFYFLISTVIFIENIFAWIRYKKQDTSDLETFALEERVLLFREGVLTETFPATVKDVTEE